MAYSQYSKFKNMGISVNGVEVYSGDLTFPVVSNDTLAWVQNNYVGGNNVIYSRQNMTNPNANYAAMEVGFTLASDELKGLWLFNHLTDNGDYVDIYNKDLGSFMSYRITRSNGGSNWLECYLSVEYPGGHVITSRGYEIYAVYSNGSTTFIPFVFLDTDNSKGAIFRGNRFTRTPLSIYDQWSLVQQPECQQPAYNNYIGSVIYAIFANYESGGSSSNPYAGGGLSGPGGGEDQNFDEVSDTIDLPALPIYGATGSGFVTAFCPTVGQINSVADYLITPNVAQVIQGLFVKLSDVIIGLHLLPFVVNATNKKNIEIKNLAFMINTGVESYYADNQYQRLDMGSVDVLKCWDNCLDYNPYTFVSIYLPFCGYFELDTDEVMGKTLHVVYDVDIITGSCVALIQVDGTVMYQFSGMCSCQIPITSVDFNQAVQSLIGLGASAAAGIKMIKGAAAATQEAASVAMAPTTKNSVRQAAYENYMEAKMNEQEIKESVASRLANASVNAVISGKGNYMHAGAVSSAPGFLACRKPFLIIKRPKQSVPEDYESMRGFPSNMKATLGDLSGYTEVEDIHLNIPDATVDEIVECERLLKGGVYL